MIADLIFKISAIVVLAILTLGMFHLQRANRVLVDILRIEMDYSTFLEDRLSVLEFMIKQGRTPHKELVRPPRPSHETRI